MKIDNAILLSRIFEDDLEIGFALCCTTPYLIIAGGRAILVIKYRDDTTASLLAANSKAIAQKIKNLLGYEIYMHRAGTPVAKLENNLGDTSMVAIIEKPEQESVTQESKLLKIETLARVTSKPIKEVKMMLGRIGAVIYPQEDASEMIAETHFDQIVLRWAKSFKDAEQVTTQESATATNDKPTTAKAKKQSTKILAEELTINDLASVKSGKNAGSPNLTEKGIQQTLTNFFSKVKLEDTTLTDAASAFIEGSSEFGTTLRKKLFLAYRKFFPGANIGEIEPKLVAGAKTYLEAIASPVKEPELEPEEN
ncbi:hypothetical protein [Iningainema tapete]|uniref:Uncharacterized protein n=1 Tax=Iningainema tapete BLCC-T55 TaxID=2748662 RepID=A0A8J7BW54_9CYAN|nr:hypothetical protein [Iningainema tapete]MBD2771152.1 hypothetical protein [Iningainema tapete BLCC-T55]